MRSIPSRSARSLALALVATVATLVPARAHAQMAQPGHSIADSLAIATGHKAMVPMATATRRVGPIVLDGKIDDAAWNAATPVTQFRQDDPKPGEPASQRTEVRFLFDDDALYVAARMYDTEGRAGVRTSLARRDANTDSDWFQVVIDGYHDHLGRAFFQVNPSGVKFDALGIGGSNPDPAWDPIWEVATSIDSLGWTAEMRIPYSQLRFSRDSIQVWGLQVRRFIFRNNEQDDWSWWGKTEQGGPPRFGHLTGVRIASVPTHLELTPYAVARDRAIRPSSPGDPFNDGSRQDMRVGGDVKYQLSSNLTLDGTVNPDFGQVEVDPAVVNLSAFETFYPEKRPFFVEGAGVFGFGGFSCQFCDNVSSLDAFYSRRIGRAPQGADLAYNAAPYADVPENATILGAAKVTGRTQSGATVGIMDAVTRSEYAQLAQNDGTRSKMEVEPATNYFVGRMKRDYNNGNLVVGAIGTSVLRGFNSDSLQNRLTSRAELVGADMRAQWDQQTYSFMASAALTDIGGDSAAIETAQLAPAHYFQRPDRSSNGFLAPALRTSATSMQGLGYYARAAKEQGDWEWEVMTNARTGGFENNDLSFLTSTDYHWYNANLLRIWTQPTSWYRQLVFLAGAQQQYAFSNGDRSNVDRHIFFSQTLPNFWQWTAFYIRDGKDFDAQVLRGGPTVQLPSGGYASFMLMSNPSKPVQLMLQNGYSYNDLGGHGESPSVSVHWRPEPNTTVEFGPSYSASTGLFQYVKAVNDPTATNFYGTRYVMSGLTQRVLSLDTRLDLTFTPTMTLETYVQPFFASGHYHDFKQFNAPRQGGYSTFGKDVGTVSESLGSDGRVATYTIDPDGAGPAQSFDVSNPDFTLWSLRGNAVFRWEYRPGSTLYFVWTQSRFDAADYGNFDVARERTALLATHPDNIFLVKATYWIGR